MPERPRILYNLALLENSQGNSILAEEYLLNALIKEPDNYDFLYAVCTFYLEHKQNQKAAVYARRLVEKYPDNPAGKQLLQAASQ
jgi:predicted Zn-dependent protease